MAALQCEICGGKLMGRPGGVFECDSCGMEYDTAWAKAKIQEIRGTVQVEGTVQVTGTVKVEGSVNLENLLKKGRMALEDFKWEDAKKAFQDALDINAECGEAYLGQLLAEQKFPNFDAMLQRRGYYLSTHPNFKRALQFMDPADAKVLQDKVDARQRMLEEEQEQRRQAQEEKQRLEEEAKQAASQRLAEVRARIAPAQKRIGCYYSLLAVGADGTVRATTCTTDKDMCSVQHWQNIKAVCAGVDHSVGLRANGTVVVTQRSKEHAYRAKGEDRVGHWKNIVDISAGWDYTVGVTADGKVLAAGSNSSGQCNVSDWENIVAVSACHLTIGLKSDGTAVATGSNLYNECLVEDWTDLVAVSAGQSHTVGLKADGTVVARGDNSSGQCYVASWQDIVAVAAGVDFTVGLKADGTVVTAGGKILNGDRLNSWKNVVAIDAGHIYIMGLTADGQVLSNSDEHNMVLRSFNHIDTLPQELAAAAEKNKARAESLKAQKAQLQAELSQLKGLFAGLKRKELETQLDQINNEIKELS